MVYAPIIYAIKSWILLIFIFITTTSSIEDHKDVIMTGRNRHSSFRISMKGNQKQAVATGYSTAISIITDFFTRLNCSNGKRRIAFAGCGVLKDQPETYVQDKIRQRAGEFFQWLENGATLYVCGAKRMGEDVERTIIDLIKNSGTTEDAETYLNELKTTGRYLKDVY
jgi:hypothetical protein